jgi:8-oxo-dGTP pyrophosphatase MutT (NUDIX family)
LPETNIPSNGSSHKQYYSFPFLSFHPKAQIMATSKSPPTLYPSSTFLESAGTVLIKQSTRQICLVYYKKRNAWLLPKGRRNIGEDRAKAAVRETEEETGYKCRLLPVTMTTSQPRAGFKDSHGGARQEGICEPFMVAHRRLQDGKMKFV